MTLKTLKDLVENFKGSKEIAVIERTGYRRFVYSYDMLYDRAKRFAILLHENQIKKGDRIIIWSYNGIDWVTVLCGSILVGVIIIPIDLRSTTEFVEKIQKEVKAKAVFQTRYKPKLRNVKTLFIEDLEYTLEKIQLRDIKDIEITVNENDSVEIVYTSGTMGNPKGVMLSHKNIVSNLNGLNQIGKIYSSYKFLSMLPLSHMFEQTGGFFIPASNSARIVYTRTLKASSILEAFQEEKITNALVVSGLLQLFHSTIIKRVKDQNKEKYFNTALKLATKFPLPRKILFYQIHKSFGGNLLYFICGGAALDPELENFFDTIGVPIVQGYGLTETAPVLTTNLPWQKKKGSVGKPLSNVHIKIADDGEILAKGANCTQGYYKDTLLTKSLFENNWLKTGDIGFLDSDGYLILKGRKKEMIKTPAGIPIYPDDIETVLKKIPGVKDSAVIGLDTPRGEKIHAILLLEKGAVPKSIIKEANTKLALHQQIISYDLWPFEDFPRTPTLKIKKFILKEFITKKGKRQVKPVEIIEKKSKIYSIISKLTDKKITFNSTLEELGLSSIDRTELVSLLEQEFYIDIDEEKILPNTRVKDIEQLVKRRVLVKGKELFKKWPLSLLSSIIRFIIQQVLLFPFVRFFSWPSIEGKENLKNIRAPVIFASNHQSYFDAPLILMKLPFKFSQKTSVAAWQEFFFTPELKYKNLGKWLLFHSLSLCFNIYPFPQQKEFKKAIRYTGKLLDNGWSILIFPEGERARTPQLLPFKQGIGVLAAEMRVPIVPIKIEGALKVLPRWKKLPSFGKVTIKIGKPLIIKTGSYIEATEEIEKAVKEL